MSLTHQIDIQHKGRSLQRVVNWFVFFMVFPCINLLDNSITFYFFLYLLIQLGFFWQQPFLGKKLLFGLILVVVLSAIFAPYSEMSRYKGFFHTFQISIQYVYWILTTCFFIIYRKYLDMEELSKWVLIGLIFFSVGFYLIDVKFGFGIGNFSSRASRNAYVFNMLCSVPLSFYYIKQRFGISRVSIFLVGFIIILMLTNGRSGGIIILIESLFISAILFPKWLKTLKLTIIPLLVLFFLFQSNNFQPVLNRLAYKLGSINPRLSELLAGNTTEGNLKMDRSWLERKLQVEKGLEIVGHRPLLGIGPGNYSSYDANLNNLASYERLSAHSADYFNKRSAHNSYVLFMGEFGLSGIILFISILLICVYNLMHKIVVGTINETHLPLVSLLGMSMHFYAIVAVTGAISWFILGLALSVSSLKLKKWR